MLNPSSIKGMLFDLDGVLYVDSSAIDGAVEAVNLIRASGICCRFVKLGGFSKGALSIIFIASQYFP